MKPILFNTEMVRATLRLIKRCTRRPIKYRGADGKKHPVPTTVEYRGIIGKWHVFEGKDTMYHIKTPYKPGDILYVRETWYYESHMHELTTGEPDLPSGLYSHRYIYKADSPDYPVGDEGWRPSIHMPKEAARVFLRVTNVRVERLRDIECISAEGVTLIPADDRRDPRYYFAKLWDSTIKKTEIPLYGWDANPWVWVIEFERCEKPEAAND